MKAQTFQRRDFVAAAIFALTTAVRLAVGLLIVKIIANVGGPEGLGQVGQFMSVLAMVSVFAGGGISTGLTKYIAEKQAQGHSLTIYLQTAFAIVLGSGALFGLVLLLSANWVGALLFGSEQYFWVIVALAICQLFIGINNFTIAIINGRRDVLGFSISTIFGSIFGVLAMYLATKSGGLDRAMLGLLLFSTATVLFSPVILWLRHKAVVSKLVPKFNRKVTLELIRFSGLQLVSAFTLPVAHIVIRSIAEDKYGWAVVGYWQGVNKISDAYLQFFLVFLANYFLPRLAEADKTEEVRRLVLGLLKIIVPVCIMLTIVIFIAKDFVIRLLFTSQFSGMAEYFAFQLIGDVLKISAYTLIYVAIARAMFRVCVAAEIIQAVVLVMLSWMGAVYFGPVGLVGGYAATYLIYFISALLIFLYWSRPDKKNYLEVI